MLDKIGFHLKYIKCTDRLRRDILDYCKKEKGNMSHEKRSEIEEVERYLKRYCFTAVPYEFVRKYRHMKIEVYRDEDGYPYVLRNGRKMFGIKEMSDSNYRDYYVGLLKEQDVRSPHCYINDKKRTPKTGSCIADVGAAEGIFALDWVEDAQKIYLFECNPKWIASLKRTFEPWKEKVEIVEKYIGKDDDENKGIISVDSFFADKKIDFIKADIEGMETDLLEGGEVTFNTRIKQVCLCAYHNQDDETKIVKLLEQYGFKHEANPGFMLYASIDMNNMVCSLEPPYLRRGVIYGEK